MGMISELFVKLGFKADEFNRGIDGAKQKTDFFSDGLKKIGGAIAGAFAVGEILNFAKEAVIGYDQAQQAATRLLTALHGNKDVQESLIKQAEKLKTKTLFDDDETVAAQAKLAMLATQRASWDQGAAMHGLIEIGDNIVFINKGKVWWEGNKSTIMTTENPELNDFVFATELTRKLRK